MKRLIIASIAVCLVLAVALTAGILLRPQTTARAEELKAAIADLSEKVTASTFSPAPTFYSNGATLSRDWDSLLEANRLGFVAAPFFLEAALQREENDFQTDYYYTASSILLRLIVAPGSAAQVLVDDVEYFTEPDAYTPHWYARKLLEYVKDAPDAVEAICQSDRPMEEKAAALQAYGLLAVPVLQRHVERGETEWNDLIANLTMAALSDDEQLVCYGEAGKNASQYTKDRRLEALWAMKQERLAGTSLPDGWYDSHREEWDLFTAKWQELIDKYGI